jgi:hypothetical protein
MKAAATQGYRRYLARTPGVRAGCCAGIAAILLVLSGCSRDEIRVVSDHSPMLDWATYRTYAWLATGQGIGGIPPRQQEILDWRIRNAVDSQMAAKGYVRTASGQPDFRMQYRIEQKEKTADTIGDYILYREQGGRQGPGEAYVFGYDEGSLVLEIKDGQTQQLMWRAAASAVIVGDKSDTRVKLAVQGMLESVPPQ